MKTAITAHRGYSARYPENSMRAFREAVSAGADRIELDVHHTADRQLVVHHDYVARSLRGEPNLIFKTPAAELRSDHDADLLPLLGDVLSEFGPRIGYEVELKGFSTEFVADVLAAVGEARVLERVEFTSFHTFLFPLLRAREPRAVTGLFVEPFPDWAGGELGLELLLARLHLGGFEVAHAPITMLTPAVLASLREQGTRIHAANCDEERDLSRAFELEVDQLSTREVERAVAIRGRGATSLA